ncbi:dual specificity protein phosphatase 22-like [Asterias rubens]|uniref:dual specificity protein phosphatase 22-like n=1 Tax=Asterias rubens TaxID=7604 RepID=UPI0014559D71|nr:dual specificity protein phosphatase 22-like [Asterias rubens]XP_033626480.1 dual specificity protein phosphatase 22-like [Asterias rubens]XP_033626481.1 dual specificity protein phosphatase 22-like [Asterias rubens]XP_033626482.1 dual specificity protein phosphatase 22-like [Asterias rubens]XP_033626484.1 dual specificity protein phosphatase 22-like [Asterias rubens]XP_033626485.1 dual specificity protein phosphatase 22-like [Asterias rubens]
MVSRCLCCCLGIPLTNLTPGVQKQPFCSLADYFSHKSMGAGMSEIIPGLFVGNFRDAKDQEALRNHNITHIVAIHDHPKGQLPHIEYLCLNSADTPTANISQFFYKSTEFIHNCRVNQGCVLVHCIAGVSRSVTLTVAYLMTVTDHGWRDCLKAVKQARQVANPNFGFQRQLQTFEHTQVGQVRDSMREKFSDSLRERDTEAIQQLLDKCNQGPQQPNQDNEFYPLPHNAYTQPDQHPPP